MSIRPFCHLSSAVYGYGLRFVYGAYCMVYCLLSFEPPVFMFLINLYSYPGAMGHGKWKGPSRYVLLRRCGISGSVQFH